MLSRSYSSAWGTSTTSTLQQSLIGPRPRVILVEKFGSLVGLITVKDVLQFIELEEATHGTTGRQQTLGSRLSLEGALEEAWVWVMDRTARLFR